MTTRDEIAASVEQQIRSMARIPKDDTEFSRDVHIFDYGYVDSFGAAELLTFCETEFSIKISDAEIVHTPMNTVNEISDVIYGKVQKK